MRKNEDYMVIRLNKSVLDYGQDGEKFCLNCSGGHPISY